MSIQVSAVLLLAIGVAGIGAGCGGSDSNPSATAQPVTVAAGASTAATATVANKPTDAAIVATVAPAVASTPAIPASSATVSGGVTPGASAAASMCVSAAEITPASAVASGDLVEVSGLASSRVNDGVIWAHNDSGDSARVFAMDAHGDALAVYTLTGSDAFDWEDMAAGPDASRGASALYLGDIGDNARARTEIVVYRVREPIVKGGAAPLAGILSEVDKLTLRYPDGAHDAETLMVDPVSGDLIIVTKDAGGSQVFRTVGTLDPNASATLELVGRVDFGALQRRTPFPDDAPALARAGGALATGGDISPSGDMIAIRTYSAVWLWTRAQGQSVGDALAAAPCEAASAAEQQGEAIAFDADGRGYVTVSEGEHPAVHHFRLAN